MTGLTDSVLRGLPDESLTKIIVMDSMDCASTSSAVAVSRTLK
jgi:hypothetical protein